MLVIRIEFHQFGTGKVREIGRMVIANTGKAARRPERGDYNVRIYRRGSKRLVLRKAEVKNYARLAYPVWHLVLRALKNAYPEVK